MSEHYHAVVWIDHREARVIHFNSTSFETKTLHAGSHPSHGHRHANAAGAGHAVADQSFLHQIVDELAKAKSVLVTGPANAKTELVKHIHQHDPRLAGLIAGVEPLDHLSEGELLAHARKYFHAADRMTPQKA